MENKSWAWFAVVGALVVSCSGKVSKNRAGPSSAGCASSTPRASSATDDAASGTANAASAQGGYAGTSRCTDDAGASFGGEAGVSSAGEGGTDALEVCVAGTCRGTREHVADAWGFTCPFELCDGNALASNCSALPGGALKTTRLDCWNHDILLFEMSATRRKACYYASTELDGAVLLVGPTVCDDEAHFCDGRATKISAGQTEDIDSCDGDQFVSTLRDVAQPEHNQPIDGPPRACYDRFAHSCEPCCPTPEPECSHKPDGYPGYACTPDTSGDRAYCSCQCSGGEW